MTGLNHSTEPFPSFIADESISLTVAFSPHVCVPLLHRFFSGPFLSLRFDQLLPCVQSKGRFLSPMQRKVGVMTMATRGRTDNMRRRVCPPSPVGARQSDSRWLASHCLSGEAGNVYNFKKNKNKKIKGLFLVVSLGISNVTLESPLLKCPQSNSVSSSASRSCNIMAIRSTSPCFEGIFVRLVLTTITKTLPCINMA